MYVQYINLKIYELPVPNFYKFNLYIREKLV